MDRQAILDCVASHAHGHDRHDSEMITAAYHDDGFDEHGKAVNPGPKYAEWINPVHAAGSQNHLHNITTHTCEIDGDVAHAGELRPGHAPRPRWADGSIHQRPVHRPPREARRRVADRRPAFDRRGDDRGGFLGIAAPDVPTSRATRGAPATRRTSPTRGRSRSTRRRRRSGDGVTDDFFAAWTS